MTLFVVVLGVVNLIVALSSLVAAEKDRGGAVPRSDERQPSVTLIVPCCGAEEGLAENVRALASQSYANLRLSVVVESRTDPAVPIVEPIIEEVRGELTVAGPAEGRGQKVHNLLAAIERASRTDVLAFADSDGRPDPGWLRRLVSALENPNVGVATTYRFYVPEPTSLATLLRSVWNASVLSLLGEHDRNFAWGGGMAIRRAVFDDVGVAAAWRGALSDDYALTHAVRRAGLAVAFVPSCLVASYGSVGLRELASWITRQIKITRVYWPALFRLAAVHHVSYSAFLLLGPWAGGLAGRTLWIAVVALGAWTGASRARRLPLARHRAWAHAALFPLASLLTVQAVVRALLSRRIEWRGRVYEMRSPTETVIVR